jgi:tetratricopeptide (TPR) repeat protein
LTTAAIRRDKAGRFNSTSICLAQDLRIIESIETTLENAVVALRTARPDEAVRLAAQVLSYEPKHRHALSLLGVALLASGRGAEAVAPLTAAAEDAGDVEIETNLAVALTHAQRFDDAVRHLERAIAIQPDLAATYQKLAVLHVMRNRLDEAEAAAIQATTHGADDGEAWATLGKILLDRGKSRAAAEAFTRALERLPGQRRADLLPLLHPLASTLIAEGEYAAAECKLREILAHARASNYPPTATAMARLDLGWCQQELGRWEEALQNYRSAIEQSPQLYSKAVTAIISSSRGRFWLKPSEFAKILPRPASAKSAIL